MQHEDSLKFITWHLEIGSALDTRVAQLGPGPLTWEGRLEGPRFKVDAMVTVRSAEGQVVAEASLLVHPESHIFDMVLGCRLFCPPGVVEIDGIHERHIGTGRYLRVPSIGCNIEWGSHGGQYTCSLNPAEIPDGFVWVPYIADEPDCWRLHSRIMAKGGTGWKRYWVLGREVLRLPVSEGGQLVASEVATTNPLYRVYRNGEYRELSVTSTIRYHTSIAVSIPDGLVP